MYRRKIIIADSDSLHYGEKIAHKVDAKMLRKIIERLNNT